MEKNDDILNSVSWGEAARKLLANLEKIIPGLPAVMILRHSERGEILDPSNIDIDLTPRGLRAAYEFGIGLPLEHTYCFFHSPVTRCRETAEKIMEGFQKKGGTIKSFKPMVSLSKIRISDITEEERARFTREIFDHIANNRWSDVLMKLISGYFPPKNLSQMYQERAQLTALEVLKILSKASPSDIIIFVSHDLHIAFYLFYWAGILQTERIQFLDGFIFQYFDDNVTFLHRDIKKEDIAPSWMKN